MKKFFGLVVGVLTFLLLTSVTFADGCYIPARAMKDYPSIPSQRAVVVHRDGIETLIIESALEGKGTGFGWVIPLPSVPTEFEAMTGGFIETLSQTVQPNITHSSPFLGLTIMLGIIILPWFFLMVAGGETKRPIMTLVGLLFVAFMFSSVMMSALGTAGVSINSSTMGIKVVDQQEIGRYQVVVLEAENADGLDKWLEMNGFAKLNDDADKIVTEYISESWCFVAAKLQREGDGYSVPHPMSLKFASERAVYPMRLTAMAKSDVYLELYIIAEGMAKAKGMELEFCDTFKFDPATGKDRISGKTFEGYSCWQSSASIGHSGAFDHMWDGCVVSKLSGTVEPDEMDKDIILKMSKAQSYRKRYYSYQGATLTGGILGTLALYVLLIFCTVRYDKQIREEGGRKFALLQIGLKSIIICFFVALSIFVSLDKVNIRGGSKLPAKYASSIDAHNFHDAIESLAKSEGLTDMSASEVKDTAERYFQKEGEDNYHTGQKREHEDSPGNFTVLEDERGVVIRGYLAGGFPVDFVLSDMQ